MRVVKEVANPGYRITIFNWNNKYIIKLETSSFEQTYKVDQFDLASDEEAVLLLDSKFMTQIMSRFEAMAIDLGNAMNRLTE